MSKLTQRIRQKTTFPTSERRHHYEKSDTRLLKGAVNSTFIFSKVVYLTQKIPVRTMTNSSKERYSTPSLVQFGGLAELTQTNQLDPFSDVPQGEIVDNGNNPPVPQS